MAIELKPCPFCGKEPKQQENRAGGIVIFCNSLDCELLSVDGEAGSAEETEAVIAAWNRRPCSPTGAHRDATRKGHYDLD
jgi:Lar family restriction alleviation protein